MAIGQMCQGNVASVAREASIQEAAQLMKEQNIGAVIVVEDKENNANPCGILTDRDIITRMLSDNIDIQQLRVDEAMSQDMLTLDENQGVKEVIEAMREKGVRRGPIVNQEGKLVGLAALDDLIVLLADELHSLAQLIQKQVHAH